MKLGSFRRKKSKDPADLRKDIPPAIKIEKEFTQESKDCIDNNLDSGETEGEKRGKKGKPCKRQGLH